MNAIADVLGGIVAQIHPFALYLIVINIVTFILCAIDRALVCHKQEKSVRLIDGRIPTIFAAAGGAVGMLCALCVFTRMRMDKDHIARWFSSIVCLIVWGLVVLVWTGTVKLSFEDFTSFNVPALAMLGVYLLAMDLVTLGAFWLDKSRAVEHGRRIPEAALLGLSLAGGALGGIAGMRAFHHKTRKWYFSAGLPIFVALHVALVLFAHAAGAV